MVCGTGIEKFRTPRSLASLLYNSIRRPHSRKLLLNQPGQDDMVLLANLLADLPIPKNIPLST